MVLKKIFSLNICEKSVISGFLIAILVSFVNFYSRCDKISNKVLRLHVIANSDSFDDQNLKLKIRDLMIDYFKSRNFKSVEEAKKFAGENLFDIKKRVQHEVLNQGFDFPVDVKICKDNFNTRTYNNISLPAGEYEALKIIIGEGKGKNWWCVMFPPMCVPAAEECNVNKNVYDQNFLRGEKDIIENKEHYKIKFKSLEIYESCHKSFSRLTEKFRKKFR